MNMECSFRGSIFEKGVLPGLVSPSLDKFFPMSYNKQATIHKQVYYFK